MLLSLRARLDLRPNRLAVVLAERRVAGRAHLDLTEANPTRAELPYDTAGIASAMTPRSALRYEPTPFGQPGARDAVAKIWAGRGLAVNASSVALTASTSEAYAFLFKLLCDPGDAVLVPRPSYPLFEHLARYEGIEAIAYPLDYDGAWYMDVARVARARTPRTRALVVVSPNNPTGSYLKKDELAGLSELGLPIISDEVFGAYPLGLDARRAGSALEATEALVFALDGLSKFALLPQMKLAWITVGGPESRVTEALSGLEHVCDAFLSPAAPVQAALTGLVTCTESTRQALRGRLAQNLAFLVQACGGTAATPLRVEGGWYAVLRMPATKPEEGWGLDVLERADVLVQPGWFYDFQKEPFLVLSLLTPEATFAEGVRRLLDVTSSA